MNHNKSHSRSRRHSNKPRACRTCHALFWSPEEKHILCNSCHMKTLKNCSICNRRFRPNKDYPTKCIKCKYLKKFNCEVCGQEYVSSYKSGGRGRGESGVEGGGERRGVDKPLNKLCGVCDSKRQTIFSNETHDLDWIRQDCRLRITYWVDKMEHSGNCANPEKIMEDHYEEIRTLPVTTDFGFENFNRHGQVKFGPMALYDRNSTNAMCCSLNRFHYSIINAILVKPR